MKKQSFLFYLVSLTIYLIVGAVQSAGASPYLLGGDKTHSHGVIDGWGANGIRINTPTVTMPAGRWRTSTSVNPRSRG